MHICNLYKTKYSPQIWESEHLSILNQSFQQLRLTFDHWSLDAYWTRSSLVHLWLISLGWTFFLFAAKHNWHPNIGSLPMLIKSLSMISRETSLPYRTATMCDIYLEPVKIDFLLTISVMRLGFICLFKLLIASFWLLTINSVQNWNFWKLEFLDRTSHTSVAMDTRNQKVFSQIWHCSVSLLIKTGAESRMFQDIPCHQPFCCCGCLKLCKRKDSTVT